MGECSRSFEISKKSIALTRTPALSKVEKIPRTFPITIPKSLSPVNVIFRKRFWMTNHFENCYRKCMTVLTNFVEGGDMPACCHLIRIFFNRRVIFSCFDWCELIDFDRLRQLKVVGQLRMRWHWVIRTEGSQIQLRKRYSILFQYCETWSFRQKIVILPVDIPIFLKLGILRGSVRNFLSLLDQ